MRSSLRSLFPALLAVSLLAGCPATDTELSDGKRLVVLFTTDEHSHLLAVAPEVDDWPLPTTAGTGALVSGVARRMTILESERAAAAARGAETITLSSGDFSQGTLASAAWIATSPELVAMKRMGYDAVSLGNHEFDLGPTALAAAVGAAAGAGAIPQLVLTNVIFSATSTADDQLAALYGTGPGKFIAPYHVIVTASGLRIGVVASIGVAAGTVAGGAPPVTFWPSAATTNEQKLGSIVAAVQTAVTTLRQTQDVDAVILLGHGGIGPEGGSFGEDELLAGLLTGVDLVVSGHTHRNTPAPRIVYAAGGKPVPVVQAKAYGREVGRVELVFPSDTAQPVRLDPAGSAFLAVDDRTLPTTDAAFVTELVTRTIGYLEAGNPAVPAYPSFLEETLSTITETTITDDPAVPGDLYFYPLGETDFDVVGLAPGETNAMNLDTDAMLAAAAKYATGPTAVAVQASGPVRGDLLVGETGVITFADLYRLVPLGGDPTVPDPATDPNAVPGFPLVRVIIPTAAIRGVFETLLQQSLLDGDFFVAPAGLVVRYDMTRDAYDQTATVCAPGAPTLPAGLCPGWVTYMGLADGTPLYDVTLPFPHFAVNPATSALPVVTTFYIASFATAFGVPLLDPANPAQPITPAAAILRRGDGSAVKDHESLAEYVLAACEANGGFLPSDYDASTAEGTVPRRMIDCTGGCP